MKIIAFNGSPRKSNNTATLLQQFLAGAESNGAETELIHLYDLQYTGCRSCFACKRLGSPTYGICAYPDDLKPIIERASTADVLVFGTPIYFADVSAQMRALLERLFFGFNAYDLEKRSLWENSPKGVIIYTMGAKDEQLFQHINFTFQGFIERHLGPVDVLSSYDAYQFDDYSKYHCPMFDIEEKKEHYAKIFPEDCKAAYALGQKLTSE